MDQVVATVVVAVATSAVTVTVAVIGYLERKRTQTEQTLVNALSYLTGGSQKRSVGIALIEGLWQRRVPHSAAITPALTNQAVYLLLETKSRTGRHQFHNWLRIMHLIMRVPVGEESQDLYIELVEALSRRIEEPERLTGIEISVSAAHRWLEKVQKHAGLDDVIQQITGLRVIQGQARIFHEKITIWEMGGLIPEARDPDGSEAA